MTTAITDRGPCSNPDCNKCTPTPWWKISRHRIQHITHSRTIKAATAEEAMLIYEQGTAWPSSYDDEGGQIVRHDDPKIEQLQPDHYLGDCCYHDLADRPAAAGLEES